VIVVTFLPVEGRRQWLAVAVPIRKSKPMVVGFVRHSVAGMNTPNGACWIARLRRRHANDALKVKAFADRSAAAKWLLTSGGYACERVLEQVA
jgi:hypothetical protein